MQFFLYEITDSTVSAVLLQLLAALGMAYICGCLYPLPFFPDAVQKIGGILPAGVASAYLRQILSGTVTPVVWGGCVLYTTVFFALTVWLRNRKMAGDNR